MNLLYRYAFGPVVYDESTGELAVAGLVVEIQARPLQVLSLLLARDGEVVSRDEFLTEVWRLPPSVETNVLANAVAKLRQALGGEGDAIETVPRRRGYRFGRPFEKTIVGRASSNTLALQAGDPVPGRDDYLLERALGSRPGHEVWVARHRTDGTRHVFKFATDADHVAGLRREARLSQLLEETLGRRDDIVRILGWNFAAPPYFVETAFCGTDLLAWTARDQRLATMSQSHRLAMFLQIGEPIAASHRALVLHKDIKPQNVLVEETDDGTVVRITDFGSGGLTDAAERERSGIAPLGAAPDASSVPDLTRRSFVYLAPELYEATRATVQTDVYALGVLLYQLAVGELAKPLAPGWERFVDDALLREDIATATDVDPARRFATVDTMIDRVRRLDERHRAADAQLAAVERQRRKDAALASADARRRRLLAAVSLLVVVLGLVSALYLQALSSKRAVAEEFAKTQTLNRFVTDEFISLADPAVSGRLDLSLHEAAERAAHSIDTDFRDVSPANRASLHATMQLSFLGLGDYPRSIEEGRKALLDRAPRERVDEEEARVQFGLASALAYLSRLDEATRALEAGERMLPDADLATPDLAVERWNLRGYIASRRPDMAAVEAAFRKANEIATHSPGVSPMSHDRALFNLADIERVSGHADAAERDLRALLAGQEQRYGTADARTCWTMVGLAGVLADEVRPDEAVTFAERGAPCLDAALGADHRKSVVGVDRLAYAYFWKERYADAIAKYRMVLDRATRNPGIDPFIVLTAKSQIGVALQLSGDPAAAEPLVADALATLRRSMPADHPLVQAFRYQLADCRLDEHRTDGVAALLDGLSKETLQGVWTNPDWDAVLTYQRARLAAGEGRRTEAVRLLQQAVPALSTEPMRRTVSVAKARALLASLEEGVPVAAQPPSR